MFRFIPERIFKSVCEINTAVLREEGVRGLILDIDYTLAPKHVPLPEKAMIDWAAALKKDGISLFVLSNNRLARVSKFADALGVPYISMGLKPFPRSFRVAVRRMGLKKSEVAAVGDQIYTDICGAHIFGIRAWLVLPMALPREPLLRLRRALEKPVLRKYYRRHPKPGGPKGDARE